MSEMFFVNSGQKYAENGIELSLANVLDNFSFYFKSLATKTGGEITFFIKFMYVTIVTFRVTTGHRSWCEMKGCL